MKRSRWSTAGWAATVLVTTLLVGCGRHETYDVNTWLRVRIRRPVNAGIFHVGPAAHAWGYAKIDGRWQAIGEGDSAGVLRLANDRAALLRFYRRDQGTRTATSTFDNIHGELLFLRADDPRPTRVRAWTGSRTVWEDLLPGNGVLNVPPTGQRVDCVVGELGSVSGGYHRLVLSSLDVNGHVGATQTVDAPDVDGRPGRFISANVIYYDRSAAPYFQVNPGVDWHWEDGPWLLAGVFPDGLRSVRSPKGTRPDRRDWERLTGGQLLRPKEFYDFPDRRPTSIPP